MSTRVRYVRLHFFDESYLNKQDEVPDELEESSGKAVAPAGGGAGGYADN